VRWAAAAVGRSARCRSAPRSAQPAPPTHAEAAVPAGDDVAAAGPYPRGGPLRSRPVIGNRPPPGSSRATRAGAVPPAPSVSGAAPDQSAPRPAPGASTPGARSEPVVLAMQRGHPFPGRAPTSPPSAAHPRPSPVSPVVTATAFAVTSHSRGGWPARRQPGCEPGEPPADKCAFPPPHGPPRTSGRPNQHEPPPRPASNGGPGSRPAGTPDSSTTPDFPSVPACPRQDRPGTKAGGHRARLGVGARRKPGTCCAAGFGHRRRPRDQPTPAGGCCRWAAGQVLPACQPQPRRSLSPVTARGAGWPPEG